MTSWLLANAGELIKEPQILKELGINLEVWLLQVVIFLFTFVILSRVLFGRVVSHLVHREKDIEGRETKLREEQAQIERLAKEYQRYIAKVEKEAYDRMQAILKEGLDSSHEMIAKAQQEAHSQIESAREAIQKERVQAGDELRTRVVELTTDACSRILDMPLEPDQVEPMIQQTLKEGN